MGRVQEISLAYSQSLLTSRPNSYPRPSSHPSMPSALRTLKQATLINGRSTPAPRYPRERLWSASSCSQSHSQEDLPPGEEANVRVCTNEKCPPPEAVGGLHQAPLSTQARPGLAAGSPICVSFHWPIARSMSQQQLKAITKPKAISGRQILKLTKDL